MQTVLKRMRGIMSLRLRLMRLSNAAPTDEFSAAYDAWRGDELGEARLNALGDEIRRREHAGLLTDDDWKIAPG
jgi:hypothetical protein